MTATWFDELRAGGVARVAEALGIRLSGKRALRPCPACGADQRGSSDRRGPVSLTADGGRWHCFRCGEGGDSVRLAALCVVGDARPSDWREVRGECARAGLCEPDEPWPGRGAE